MVFPVEFFQVVFEAPFWLRRATAPAWVGCAFCSPISANRFPSGGLYRGGLAGASRLKQGGCERRLQ